MSWGFVLCSLGCLMATGGPPCVGLSSKQERSEKLQDFTFELYENQTFQLHCGWASSSDVTSIIIYSRNFWQAEGGSWKVIGSVNSNGDNATDGGFRVISQQNLTRFYLPIESDLPLRDDADQYRCNSTIFNTRTNTFQELSKTIVVRDSTRDLKEMLLEINTAIEKVNASSQEKDLAVNAQNAQIKSFNETSQDVKQEIEYLKLQIVELNQTLQVHMEEESERLKNISEIQEAYRLLSQSLRDGNLFKAYNATVDGLRIYSTLAVARSSTDAKSHCDVIGGKLAEGPVKQIAEIAKVLKEEGSPGYWHWIGWVRSDNKWVANVTREEIEGHGFDPNLSTEAACSFAHPSKKPFAYKCSSDNAYPALCTIG